MQFLAILKQVYSFVVMIPEIYKVYLAIKKALDGMKKDRFNDGIAELENANTSEEIKNAARKIAKNS